MKRVQPFVSLAITILAVLAFSLVTGCSSSPKGEDEIPLDDGGMSADAETDAVPQDEPEAMAGLEAPVDPNAPTDAPVDPYAQENPPSPPALSADDSSSARAFSGETTEYVVQAGDTLMKIAFEVYGDLYRWKDIYEANRDRISDLNSLSAGVAFRMEKPSVPVVIERNGDRYLIKSGDTLGTISRDVYGSTSRWKDIWQNNRQMIRDPNKIFAGFYLYYVPDHGVPRETQLSPAPLAQPMQQSPDRASEAREPAADGSFSEDAGFAPSLNE